MATPADVHSGHWVPETEAERAAIRQQLDRLLASPIFMNSKRCASLLRFVVDCALEGKADHLKERTLGVDVFQREPDYDTNRIPVVRTTAVEIRKRIAQYYNAPEHEGEIRIGFPAGSYVPEFKMPVGWSDGNSEIRGQPPISHGQTSTAAVFPKRNWLAVPEFPNFRLSRISPRISQISLVGLAAGIAVAAVLFYLANAKTASPALDRFWRPVLASAEPVLLLIGGPEVATDAPQQDPPVTVIELQNEERVAFADAATLSRITGVMMTKGKAFHIRRHRSAKLEDLREGPTVLIGAFNNQWTIRLADQARYSFVRDAATHTTWIADRDNANDRRWLVHQAEPYRSVAEDYALVSRVLDPTTGHLVVTAAGMTKFGTAAAGEFLSEPAYMQEALRGAPKGWYAKNVQIVLATTLVGESSGPPRVIATHFW